MTIKLELKDVTAENFWQVVFLKSMEYEGYRLFEEHVASNAFSLAQAKVEPEWETKAIYVDGKVIGFAMYGWSNLLNVYFITRLMIDYREQRKGYGKAAMLEILEDMKKYNAEAIYISFMPANIGAKKLYEGLGFLDTGEFVEFGGEREPLFKLEPAAYQALST